MRTRTLLVVSFVVSLLTFGVFAGCSSECDYMTADELAEAHANGDCDGWLLP